MNRSSLLCRTPSAEIFRFDHPPDREHHDSEAEVASWYAVSFLERGSYNLAHRADSWTLVPGDVELTYPDTPVEYRHPSSLPRDVCLTVRFAPEVVAQTFGSLPNRAGPLRVPASDRTLFERYRLSQSLGDADSLGMDFAVHTLMPLLYGSADRLATTLHQGKRFSVYLRRVRSAVELLTHEFTQQHSVAELARRLAMSPFHFTRTFTALVGCPPHHYLLQVRLRTAALRLLEGDTVTNAAFACGFQNLSHFVRTFRKRFGVSPGRFRSAHPQDGSRRRVHGAASASRE